MTPGDGRRRESSPTWDYDEGRLVQLGDHDEGCLVQLGDHGVDRLALFQGLVVGDEFLHSIDDELNELALHNKHVHK